MGYSLKLVAAISLGSALLLQRLAPFGTQTPSLWLTVFSLFWLQTLSYAAWALVLFPKYFTPLRHLPTPSGGSFFHGQHSRIAAEPSGYPHADWAEKIPNDGLIYYTTILNSPRVLVTNAKGLAEVLTQKSYEFVKPGHMRSGLGRLLGVGILLAEGDEHKRQRKLLSPAFSFRHVKDLYPVFWAKGREMVLGMDEAITNPDPTSEKASNVVNVGNWANRTTLDIIGLSGMGKDFNALQNPKNELFQTYQKVFGDGNRGARLLGMMSVFLPFWLVKAIPIKRNSDVQEASDVIKRTAYNLIQTKRAKLEKGETDVDILSVAMRSGGFSDEDLVNQLMTFLAAGHETTASAMNWALLLLCQHPDVQTRLRADLQAAGLPSAHDEAATVSASDIENIPYLSAVCNEVLRLRPPVGVTFRQAAGNSTILGQRIPKGTSVVLSPMANNHSTEMWGPDAGEFNPERWMAPGCHNSGGAKSNYAYMTFLHGPRSCIGSGFAKAEFMCLLAAWVSSFSTELEDPERVIEVGGGVTSKPKGGLPVKITPVEG